MGLDFDAIDFCRTLIRTPAPYKCPVDKCGKSYKSIYGLQYHLVNFDHNSPNGTPPIKPTPVAPMPITATPQRKKGGNRSRVAGGGGSAAPKHQAQQQHVSPPKEALTYLEAQKVVQFDIDGKSIKASVEEPIAIITQEQYEKMLEDKECVPFVECAKESHIKLPEASYKMREDYNICDAPPRPNAYIRFIEKSAEELDGEVEYDVDEEDTTWLAIINDRRAEQGLAAVSVDTLELLMDRLEKESYFQAAANGQSGVEVDDDAVCSICVDGECQNTNVILFCDMCNLAVHQDCYGVPYIPEGQWLCRRCLQSPSRPVDCVLCPNTGGAFKQTDHNQWAHVVCALWIPEVRFANTVFLEPIDSIETIPAARWRLTCYICKQKGVGACIQCQRSSCYAAFHVTCAQQAGLHMRMDTVKDNNNAVHPIIVQKTAYCDAHCPAGALTEAAANDSEELRKKSRIKMKLARETLAKKRTSVPLILIPTIPPDRLQEITSLVNVPKKSTFIQRLIAYWTLKRQYRNGVPLLRRLQSQSSQGARGIEGSPNAKELYQQLKYWQCLRQDLERARLLCELVRKREKLKVAYIRTKEAVVMMELNPIEATMGKLLEAIEAKDNTEIFREPVDVNEVPDYMDVVTHPMDLSTMRLKLMSGMYFSLNAMHADFDLMIRNCLAYNNKDTIFYRAGVRMRDQCAPLFRAARQELETDGLVETQKTDDHLAKEIDDEFREVLKMTASEALVDRLQLLLEKALRLKHGLVRAKRTKHIRIEMTKIKKILNKGVLGRNAQTDSSQSDMEVIMPSGAGGRLPGGGGGGGGIDTGLTPVGGLMSALSVTVTQQPLQMLQTPPCSPLKSAAHNSASPSGVNRRTAVLFTRKAQANQRKPDTPVKEESTGLGGDGADTSLSPVDKLKSPKKPGRTKRNSSRKSIESVDTTTPLNLPQPSIASGNTVTNNSSFDKKRSPPVAKALPSSAASSAVRGSGGFEVIPDSFRVYRAQDQRGLSDSEDSHLSYSGSSCSSCSGFDDSGTGSDFGSSGNEINASASDSEMASSEVDTTVPTPKPPAPNQASTSKADAATTRQSAADDSNASTTAPTSTAASVLEPLQLVWAKCRGYPWYPALIIDPAIPKGFIYNGVPLPAPPADVLALRKDGLDESPFLVLFFDAKRTWQWLPANKLELLGLDKQLDQAKLVESRKPADRKAVKKAYQDALHYQSQVSDLDGQGPGAIM